jgi:uncharacterized Zn finger protein (UPF0148 family)
MTDNHCPTCGGTGCLKVNGEYIQCPTCSGSFIVITEGKKVEGKVEGINASDVADVMNAVINPDKKSGLTITVSNSNVGVINTGDMENIKSISMNIHTLVKSDNVEVAQAFNKLSNAIATSNEFTSAQRSELIELLKELAKEAGKKPNERLGKAPIKAIFSSLATGIGMAGGLSEIWSTWGSIVSRFFGF